MQDRVNVLLVGCGGIGTIAALNLEYGKQAAVTAVLRSNHDIVKQRGFNIRSIDHGVVNGFKPSNIRDRIPNVVEEKLPPFKYVVCTTKNYADIPPTVAELIAPAVTPGCTVIVLIQNGLNIERPMFEPFPENIVLSGVSFCGSHEVGSGEIVHEDNDELSIGAFRNPGLNTPEGRAAEDKAAEQFASLYAAGGKCEVEVKPDVGWTRWRKLLYNACLNPICAVTDLDTGRIQLADGALDTLVRPAMQEIRAAAKACGHELPEELVEAMIRMDPISMYNPPSMLVDIRKGRFCEYETILGEPLREGMRNGVSMPMIATFYNILKAMQWNTKQKKGMVAIPEPEDHSIKR